MPVRNASPEPRIGTIATRCGVQSAWVRGLAGRLDILLSLSPRVLDTPFSRGLGEDFTPEVAAALTAAQNAPADIG